MRALLLAAALTGALLAVPATAEAATTCGAAGSKVVITKTSWRGYPVTVTTSVAYRNCVVNGKKVQRYYSAAGALSASTACTHGFKGVVTRRVNTSTGGRAVWIFGLSCSARTASDGVDRSLAYSASGVSHGNSLTFL